MGYCKTMFENIKIYTSDKYWKQILADLGAVIVDNQNAADVVFDTSNITAPISVMDLKNIIFNSVNNTDVIRAVFGKDIVLPALQRKIIVSLYNNPNENMVELKKSIGVMPGVATHAVENAIYQLRKIYGHDFIQNVNGKYKIGRI